MSRSQTYGEVELVRVIAAEYRVPGGNRVTLSPQLADEIREHFNIDSRKLLYLGRRPNAWVVGLSDAESDDLLDSLWA